MHLRTRRRACSRSADREGIRPPTLPGVPTVISNRTQPVGRRTTRCRHLRKRHRHIGDDASDSQYPESDTSGSSPRSVAVRRGIPVHLIDLDIPKKTHLGEHRRPVTVRGRPLDRSPPRPEGGCVVLFGGATCTRRTRAFTGAKASNSYWGVRSVSLCHFFQDGQARSSSNARPGTA